MRDGTTGDGTTGWLSDQGPAREFAISIVQRLRAAGYQAVWAGGCVRDQLLDRQPSDYDVATNALPSQVQDLFGTRRTLAVGAEFGVIIVLGPTRHIQVEVATFRRDAEYSDGRHPDSVSFSSDREDAQRRDFTINGLFLDPITNQVIDYVGGVEDLEREVIRAIGNPVDRIREDKLRMLRAVRFTATFGFRLEAKTMAAVQTHAASLGQVSAERIAAELRRMLAHPHRAAAARLLDECCLLLEIFPEFQTISSAEPSTRKSIGNTDAWRLVERRLTLLNLPDSWNVTERFVTSMACLLSPIASEAGSACRRLKLSREEQSSIVWLLNNVTTVIDAETVPWPNVQRVLIHPFAKQLVAYADASASACGDALGGVAFCRGWLSRPSDELNPSPLINGDDLVARGLKPGRLFRRILSEVRDAQLRQEVSTKESAIELAIRIARQSQP